MKFEELANELLFEVFEFIDFIQLLRAFYNLNTRFNKLIFIHYKTYHINFRSISKYEFNIICEKYLPLILNRIISLYISNDDETPNLSYLFYSYGFTLNKFHNLQILLLNSIQSFSILNNIIFQCQNLEYFTHLYIIKCYLKEQKKFSYLIKNIWNLSKLIYCKINNQYSSRFKFPNDIITSLSIKKLFLENFIFDLNDLSNLFQYTPLLEQFNGNIKYYSECKQLYIISSSITSLNISFQYTKHAMINLFENLPNLYRLKINTRYIYINGYEWKNIIMNYLLKIKIFQLKMDFYFNHPKNIEKQLDELLNSFHTSFWIEEHQWFIQCDWISSNIKNFCTLYTLPYVFKEYFLTNNLWSKSTGSINNQYNHVNTLTIVNIKKDNSLFFTNFQNIYHLKIHLPLNNNFWLFIQSLNKLITLDIILIQNISYLPLQILFDQSPNLYSLCLGNFNNLQIISQLKSRSIYRLDFIKKNTYKIYFNNTQCLELINSSIGRQCKILLINVENRINIIQLINNMSNIQSLTFQCKDDQWNNNNEEIIQYDELIQWLYYYLPSTCSIIRDKYQTSIIRLWVN